MISHHAIRFSRRNIVCLLIPAFIVVYYQYQPSIKIITKFHPKNNILLKNLTPTLKYSSGRKPFTIFFWTKWYGGDPTGFNNPDCQNEYRIISNRSQYDEADVVMFQFVDLNRTSNADLPKTRDPDVPWILTMQEAPVNHPSWDPRIYNGVFNFTSTFRTDSEIYTVFNETLKTWNQKPDTHWVYGSNFSHHFLNNKTKTAAWVVSNCIIQPSNRNELVKALVEHGIQVDIYGNCGNHTCGKESNCFEKLGKEYKFYMALENSLCVDYITEKITHGLFHNMVPIVWGLGNNLDNYAPPGSYIDAMEFTNISDLATKIKFLDENPKEYFKYFEWRQMYNLSSINDPHYKCYGWRKIKQVTERFLLANKTHTYDNLDQWYYFFRNENTGQFCPNCLSSHEVDVINLRKNKLNVFNKTGHRCVYWK